MSDDFQELENTIRAEMNVHYSATVMKHAFNPNNMGLMPAPDGYAKLTGPCGDTMEIWLRVYKGIIEEASFETDGCGTSVAAGSMATELITGKTIDAAMQISQQDILDALEGLPDESKHCALLAANTIKEAVEDYYEYSRDKWKRNYKKQW